jgi:hypothetical protein
MNTLPTHTERRLTRRQALAALDAGRDIIAEQDKTIAEQETLIDTVIRERDEAYESVGRAEDTAHRLEDALAELRRMHDQVRHADAARDQALRAAEQAQQVTLKLLDVHHRQGLEAATVVQSLGKAIAEALAPRQLEAAPVPPEVLANGSHALGADDVLVPVDGPTRKQARR